MEIRNLGGVGEPLSLLRPALDLWVEDKKPPIWLSHIAYRINMSLSGL